MQNMQAKYTKYAKFQFQFQFRKAKQSKAKQIKAKQSKAKQSKAKQSFSFNFNFNFNSVLSTIEFRLVPASFMCVSLSQVSPSQVFQGPGIPSQVSPCPPRPSALSIAARGESAAAHRATGSCHRQAPRRDNHGREILPQVRAPLSCR